MTYTSEMLARGSERLQPCPFCGSRAYLNWANNSSGLFIECCAERAQPKGCHAFMYRAIPAHSSENVIDNLVERWNRRSP